ncbi:MAG: hypothetical protein Q9209_006584 [Squamulea sp. 1 TL-2023]
MSTVEEITSGDAFSTHTSSLPPTTTLVISFHTPWAAPCAQMSLILKTLASSYPPQSPPTISFISLDAEALPEISESYDVTAVPFLVIERDGKILEKVSGSDAAKVRAAVERQVGKGGNTGKVGLPPALEVTRREEDNTEGEKVAETNGEGGKGGGGLSKYAPGADDPKTAPEMSSTEGQKEELETRLQELVKAAPVMLFMKGTPSAPQPTFPQLYAGGEFVGGLDIVKEELENNPDFFADYKAAPKGKGGMAAAEDQKQSATASA